MIWEKKSAHLAKINNKKSFKPSMYSLEKPQFSFIFHLLLRLTKNIYSFGFIFFIDGWQKERINNSQLKQAVEDKSASNILVPQS